MDNLKSTVCVSPVKIKSMTKNNQTNLFIISILVMVGVILTSGCLNEEKVLPSYPKYTSNNNALTPLQICEKISDKQPKYHCFAEIKEFDKILDSDLKNYYLAIENHNPELCKNIKNDLKLDCYNKLVDGEDLIKYVDPSICKEQWYGCYFRFAIITGNISLCEKIDPELNEKEECYIGIVEKTGDASVCEKVSNDNKDRCFGWVCVKTTNTKYCEKIRKQEFKDIYYSFLADKQNNDSYCEKIKDSYYREQCIMDIKYPNGSYIEHCDEIINSKLKSSCYSQFAINKSDFSLCEKVIDIKDKDYCYSNIAKETGNEKLCEKIRDNEKKNFCYFAIAINENNSELCKKINRYQCKAGCLGLVKNPEYCNEITSPIKMKSACIVDAATRNKDITICENLSYSPDGCYSSVARSIYKHGNDITTDYFGHYGYETYLCSKNIFNIFDH